MVVGSTTRGTGRPSSRMLRRRSRASTRSGWRVEEPASERHARSPPDTLPRAGTTSLARPPRSHGSGRSVEPRCAAQKRSVIPRQRREPASGVVWTSFVQACYSIGRCTMRPSLRGDESEPAMAAGTTRSVRPCSTDGDIPAYRVRAPAGSGRPLPLAVHARVHDLCAAASTLLPHTPSLLSRENVAAAAFRSTTGFLTMGGTGFEPVTSCL